VSSEQIEDVMSMLSRDGHQRHRERRDRGRRGQPPATDLVETSTSRELAVGTSTSETLDRTDDPVRMYLREMGSVELLSREGEIAIAKRIEAGRNTMIAGLCESPLTFQAITIWRDELLSRTSCCATSSTSKPPSAARWTTMARTRGGRGAGGRRVRNQRQCGR
jgi:RNA polymerase primary sigma factor